MATEPKRFTGEFPTRRCHPFLGGGHRNQNRNGVIVGVVVIMVDRDRDPPPDRGRGHDRVPPQSWGAVGDHD